jgi:hypothetical protein
MVICYIYGHLVYFIAFGKFGGNLVHFSLLVSRKIWQPCTEIGASASFSIYKKLRRFISADETQVFDDDDDDEKKRLSPQQ